MGSGEFENTIIEYDENCGTNVVIPSIIEGKTVLKIGGISAGAQYNFSGNFNKFILPKTLKRIESLAFGNNSSISSGLTLPEGFETLLESEELSLSRVILPESLEEIDAYNLTVQNNYIVFPGNFSINGATPRRFCQQ